METGATTEVRYPGFQGSPEIASMLGQLKQDGADNATCYGILNRVQRLFGGTDLIHAATNKRGQSSYLSPEAALTFAVFLALQTVPGAEVVASSVSGGNIWVRLEAGWGLKVELGIGMKAQRGGHAPRSDGSRRFDMDMEYDVNVSSTSRNLSQARCLAGLVNRLCELGELIQCTLGNLPIAEVHPAKESDGTP